MPSRCPNVMRVGTVNGRTKVGDPLGFAQAAPPGAAEIEVMGVAGCFGPLQVVWQIEWNQIGVLTVFFIDSVEPLALQGDRVTGEPVIGPVEFFDIEGPVTTHAKQMAVAMMNQFQSPVVIKHR